MAGHSKWNNIKQRKGAQDAKRGKIFQKLSKEIYQAAKDGGPDPEMNAALRQAVDNAKAQNVPNDNIDRAIKRATDAGEGNDYEDVLYEGFGPNGVALLVEGLTDNANRTSSNVKAAFTKNNANLGAQGSVNYMFDHKGYFVIEREDLEVEEDDMLMTAIEAGADDMETSEAVFELYTEPNDFADVRDALKEAGYEDFAQAQLVYVPKNTMEVDDETQAQVEALMEVLEDDEDISDVYHNGDF